MRNERGILAAVTALHATIGAWIAMVVPGPVLAVDDLAFLAMGRTLAGEGAAPLAAQPPYGALYPALLAPGWALGLDESSMLVWSRVVNGLAGAALVPVLYFLVRRLGGASRWWALAAAIIGASLPAHMATASIVWGERLLALLVAVSVLCLLRLHERPSVGRAAAVAASAVALYATHPRMGVPAGVVIVAGVWMTHRRSRIAAVVAGSGFVGLLVAEWLRRTLAEATFGSTGTYDVGDLASRRGIGEVPDMVIRGTGTIAYLVLATAGLAVIGFVLLLRSRPVGLWVLAIGGAVIGVAGWFLTGVDRSDAYLHGRYIEVIAPVLVALGVIGVARIWLVWSAALVTGSVVIAGFWGAWAGPGNNWSRPRSPVMMLGTEAGGAPFGTDIFEPGAAALVALIVGGALVGALRRPRPWAGLAVAVVVVGLGTASDLEGLDQLYDGSVAGTVDAALDDVEIQQVAFDPGRVSANLAGAVAWHVGLDRSASEIGPDTSHLLLPVDEVPPSGAEMVFEFELGTLWALA